MNEGPHTTGYSNEKQLEFRVWLPSKRIILKFYVYQGSHAIKSYWPSEPTRCGLTFSYCINTITAPQISHKHMHTLNFFSTPYIVQVLSTHRPELHLKPTDWSHCTSILQTVLTLGPGTSRRSSCCVHTADGAVYSAGLLNTVRGVTALLHFPKEWFEKWKWESKTHRAESEPQSPTESRDTAGGLRRGAWDHPWTSSVRVVDQIWN